MTIAMIDFFLILMALLFAGSSGVRLLGHQRLGDWGYLTLGCVLLLILLMTLGA